MRAPRANARTSAAGPLHSSPPRIPSPLALDHASSPPSSLANFAVLATPRRRRLRRGPTVQTRPRLACAVHMHAGRGFTCTTPSHALFSRGAELRPSVLAASKPSLALLCSTLAYPSLSSFPPTSPCPASRTGRCCLAPPPRACSLAEPLRRDHEHRLTLTARAGLARARITQAAASRFGFPSARMGTRLALVPTVLAAPPRRHKPSTVLARARVRPALPRQSGDAALVPWPCHRRRALAR